jgi:hypothetical protein
MPNNLGRPASSQNGLFRSVVAELQAGQISGLSWNTRRHGLVLMPDSKMAKVKGRQFYRGSFTSAPVHTQFPFHEFLPSWNLQLDEKSQGYKIEVRFGNDAGKWSPWFYFGTGGTFSGQTAKPRISAKGWGEVFIDYSVLQRPASCFQFRVQMESTPEALADPARRAVFNRFFAAYANPQTIDVNTGIKRTAPTAATNAKIELPIPYRSQYEVSNKRLGKIICCPTCLSMILEWMGINKPTLEIAAEAYDPEHKVYGIWPRAAQTAANHGLEAWVQRFSSHHEVLQCLSAGLPLVASIRAKIGELPAAKYPKTKGHLVLITGITAVGNYIVNDPASAGPKGAKIEYSADEMDKVWLDKGGVAIVIRKPEHD